MENIAFFLPVRKGSLRVKNKNTRQFSNIAGGLLENKLNQLMQTINITEILVSTNDDNCIEIVEKFMQQDTRLKILRRTDALCLDTTDLLDLIAYVPTITDAKHILWGHVTTPIVDAAEYDRAIDTYFLKRAEGYDSLVSVVEFKNFLLNKDGKVVNNSTSILWPRTQDIEMLYEINHAIFFASRDVYIQQKNRIGKKPFLYVMNKLNSFDIDSEEDFMIAEIIFNGISSYQNR